MAEPFATIIDIEAEWRTLSASEAARASSLLPIVSDRLRQRAKDMGSDLDAMLESGELLPNVAKSVTVEIVARTLLTSTSAEPLTQFSQGAGGYTMSGTYLVPGGGIFIKREDLKALGIRRQKLAMVSAELGVFDGKPQGS